MSQAGYADQIISEANALVAKVSGDLQQGTEFYRAMGIDPDKVLPACEAAMGPKQREELAHMLARDQEDVQREVDEAAARARFAAAPAAPARKPRTMI